MEAAILIVLVAFVLLDLLVTYNEAVARLAAAMRQQGSIDRIDVERLFDRMSPR
jgi:hypothetical protein